jgi:hypothetical protein
MRATLTYTLGRLLLFVAALGLMYLAGARGLLQVGLALLISGIISFIVLSRLRDAMSGALTSRISSFRQRLDEGARVEDDEPAADDDPVSVGEPAPDAHP